MNSFGEVPQLAYWVFHIPTYGRFVKYCTEAVAERTLVDYSLWNHVKGYKHKADINNKKDKELVSKEIIGCAEDRRHHVPDIPWMPAEGWV